ncbi:MAG: hypothetical protein EXR83_07240 [Gammaproteobacteria bacterium]|nr:hypothetical protein [Gammaproteobacteria bacterium]
MIVSVATFGLMLAVSSAVSRSADPLIQEQATTLARAYLAEAMSASFCDPSFNPDGSAATTCRAECTGRPCASGCGGAVFGAESSRANYDDVCDYLGLSDVGARDRNGLSIALLGAYTVNVSVLDQSSVTLGSPALDASSGQIVRVEVAVSHNALNAPIRITAYKANLE